MRLARKLGVLLVALMLVALLTPDSTETAEAHHAPSLPGVVVQPPFSGYWNKFGYFESHPSRHHIKKDGDWSVDIYKHPGYSVKVRAYPVSQSGAVSYKIVDVDPYACASNVYADGGRAVKVEIWYQGKKIGHVWYLHLAKVQVSEGQWVPHGQTLGFTAGFNYDSNPGECYEVTRDEGVHVHVEVRSSVHYACFYDWPAGQWLEYYSKIGKMGGQYALSPRQAC